MFSTFDFDVIRRSLGYLFLDGMTFTLTLTALSAVGGLVFGTLIALMRLSGLKLLSRIAGLYVDLMRSLPLVLVIFWFYFLVPYIGQWLTGSSRPIKVGAFASSLITFILFEAAYFSEIMRAGIQSISKGQPAAANALGLTTVWVNRRHDRPGSGATPPAAARPDLEVPDLRTLAHLASAEPASQR